jgi:hypothetical protein
MGLLVKGLWTEMNQATVKDHYWTHCCAIDQLLFVIYINDEKKHVSAKHEYFHHPVNNLIVTLGYMSSFKQHSSYH